MKLIEKTLIILEQKKLPQPMLGYANSIRLINDILEDIQWELLKINDGDKN